MDDAAVSLIEGQPSQRSPVAGLIGCPQRCGLIEAIVSQLKVALTSSASCYSQSIECEVIGEALGYGPEMTFGIVMAKLTCPKLGRH